MPELPDVTIYLEALEKRILHQPLLGVRFASPFLLRTVDPPIGAVRGKRVRRLRRLGKRIAIGCEDDLWLVMHRSRALAMEDVLEDQGLDDALAARRAEAVAL